MNLYIVLVPKVQQLSTYSLLSVFLFIENWKRIQYSNTFSTSFQCLKILCMWCVVEGNPRWFIKGYWNLIRCGSICGTRNQIFHLTTTSLTTLESGKNIAPWIKVAPGKFGKKNKCSVAPFIPYTSKIGSMESGIKP